MKKLFEHIGGILTAFIAWWGVAVLLGLLMYWIWPAGGSHVAGISLDPQNIPGNFAGFILALYAFRAVMGARERRSVVKPEPDTETTPGQNNRVE